MAAIGGIMFLLIYNDEVEEMKSATFEAAQKIRLEQSKEESERVELKRLTEKYAP